MFFPSIFNPRYKKLTLILTQFSIEIAIIAVLLTLNKTPNISYDSNNVFQSSEVGLLVVYALGAAGVSNLIIYLFAGFFRVTPHQRQRLNKVVNSGSEMLILKEW